MSYRIDSADGSEISCGYGTLRKAVDSAQSVANRTGKTLYASEDSLGAESVEVAPTLTPDRVRALISDLTFVVPPENQGQIVEASYACDADYIYERSVDRSDRSTSVWVYEHPETEADGDWAPQNGSPELGEHVATVTL